MDDYLKWLNDQIEFEAEWVANEVLTVLSGKRLDTKSLEKSGVRHSALTEARQKYEEFIANQRRSP